MLTRFIKTHAKRFASAAVVLTLAGAFVARPSFARLSANTIDPVAIISDQGRHLIVTGPVVCTDSERTDLRAMVTQRSTCAVAEGRGLFACTGVAQQWEVQASTEGEAAFQTGPATVVALARTTSFGQTTDAH